MELTEFDVRLCYAPNSAAKVQLFFGMCKKIWVFFAHNLRMSNIYYTFGRRLASLTLRNSPEITFAISGVYPNNLPKNEINSIFLLNYLAMSAFCSNFGTPLP